MLLNICAKFHPFSPISSIMVKPSLIMRYPLVFVRYNGVCDDGFSFESPKNEKSNSFTQLVWKDTHFIGVGVSNATEKDNKGNFCKFVVVEYRPPGSITFYLFKKTYYKGKIPLQSRMKLCAIKAFAVIVCVVIVLHHLGVSRFLFHGKLPSQEIVFVFYLF